MPRGNQRSGQFSSHPPQPRKERRCGDDLLAAETGRIGLQSYKQKPYSARKLRNEGDRRQVSVPLELRFIAQRVILVTASWASVRIAEFGITTTRELTSRLAPTAAFGAARYRSGPAAWPTMIASKRGFSLSPSGNPWCRSQFAGFDVFRTQQPVASVWAERLSGPALAVPLEMGLEPSQRNALIHRQRANSTDP